MIKIVKLHLEFVLSDTHIYQFTTSSFTDSISGRVGLELVRFRSELFPSFETFHPILYFVAIRLTIQVHGPKWFNNGALFP